MALKISYVQSDFSDSFEHVRDLPQLLHVDFHLDDHGRIATVNADTPFSALSTVSEALAILLLAFDLVASTWWKLNTFNFEWTCHCLVRTRILLLF